MLTTQARAIGCWSEWSRAGWQEVRSPAKNEGVRVRLGGMAKGFGTAVLEKGRGSETSKEDRPPEAFPVPPDWGEGHRWWRQGRTRWQRLCLPDHACLRLGLRFWLYLGQSPRDIILGIVGKVQTASPNPLRFWGLMADVAGQMGRCKRRVGI